VFPKHNIIANLLTDLRALVNCLLWCLVRPYTFRYQTKTDEELFSLDQVGNESQHFVWNI